MTLDGTRKTYLADLAAVPLLIVDDLGMRKLPHTAAEEAPQRKFPRKTPANTLPNARQFRASPPNVG